MTLLSQLLLSYFRRQELETDLIVSPAHRSRHLDDRERDELFWIYLKIHVQTLLTFQNKAI